MEKIKNISIGFLVSFIGSIPIGYLNLVGLEIYSKSGFCKLIFFLLGVIFTETFIIYFTIHFAKQLLNHKKIMKIMDFFSVVCMFVLAYVFFLHTNHKESSNTPFIQYLIYPSFIIGVILNCFNFMQLPFWTTWNLYLINEKYISIEGKLKYYYIAGTLTGIFSGMLSFIVIIKTIVLTANIFSKDIISIFIPLFFVILGSIQMFKVYKKHLKSGFMN